MYKRISKHIIRIKKDFGYWPTTTILWERGFEDYVGDPVKLAVFKKMLVLMKECGLICPLDNGETIRLSYNPINQDKKIELLKKRMKEEISAINKNSINSIKQISLFNFDDEEE